MWKRLLQFFNFPTQIKSSERGRFSKVGTGYARTSVNTSIFRKSSIASHGDTQFISYYDRKGRVVIGKRNLNKVLERLKSNNELGRLKRNIGRWRLKRLPFKGKVTDAHNVISIGIDGDGYLHMAYGMHNAPLNYLRSKKPGGLSMEQLDRMDIVEETRVTYPEFFTLPDGDLLFVYRSGSSGNGNMVMKRYSVKDKQWETLHKNLIDGEGERNAYWQMCVDSRGVIHVSWVWRESKDVASNHDLCYARSLDGGKSWQRSNGEAYLLPINEGNAEVVCRIPQNSELMNQTSMTADDEGNVYIAGYWRDADSEVPQYRIVWNRGRGWNVSQVGNRVMPFSLKGGGTKMVPISRPVVLTRGEEVILIFRDVERGSRVTIGVTSDIEKGEWEFHDITEFSVGAWEPSYDMELWKDKGILNLYIQQVYQGDGEKVSSEGEGGTPIWVWEEKKGVRK